MSVATEKQWKTRPVHPISARQPEIASGQIDLTTVYNAALNDAWLPTSSLQTLGQDLSALPTGLQTLESVRFEIRGLIQLGRADPKWSRFPERVRIPAGRRFRQFHVLHGTVNGEREGVVVGGYRLCYTDGQELEFEIRYGLDLRHWLISADPKPPGEGSTVAWTGTATWAPTSDEAVRLIRTSYSNPRPNAEVASIDFASQMTGVAPFLVALTVE